MAILLAFPSHFPMPFCIFHDYVFIVFEFFLSAGYLKLSWWGLSLQLFTLVFQERARIFSYKLASHSFVIDQQTPQVFIVSKSTVTVLMVKYVSRNPSRSVDIFHYHKLSNFLYKCLNSFSKFLFWNTKEAVFLRLS